MRKPKHLSHTALQCWFDNRDEFFLRYLADDRPPKPPQEKPAAVGSAFDAYIKDAIARDVGYPGKSFATLFESQVEPHNRDFARKAGLHVFQNFVGCGQYSALMKILDDPLEIEMEERKTAVVDGVPLTGFPDLFVLTRDRVQLLDDFKVCGYCSKSTTSPSKGYIWCVDGIGWPKPSRSNQTTHKNCELSTLLAITDTIEYNAVPLEKCNEKYAAQLATYGWIMGNAVGNQSLHSVHECVAKPSGSGPPLLRFATMRGYISRFYQEALLELYKICWHAIQGGHIFDQMSREESDQRCEVLNDSATYLANGDRDAADKFFADQARTRRFGA